jgi:hypothetical protein
MATLTSRAMSGLRQQVPSSRHSVLRRNLEYHRVANSPRGIAYAVAVLLAQGAPTGLLLTRLARRGKFSWRSVGNEIVSDGATYAYVAGSTTNTDTWLVTAHSNQSRARFATRSVRSTSRRVSEETSLVCLRRARTARRR